MDAVLLIGALALAPVIGGGFGELACAVIQILVFAALICRLVKNTPDSWMKVPGFASFAIFLALVCISTLFTESIYASLRFLIYAFTCVLAYILAGSMCRDRRVAACFVWILTLTALGISAFGVRDYATGAGGGIHFWKSLLSEGDHWRLFGTFINPSFFAGFLVITIPVALGVYLVTRRTVFALMAGIAFVIEVVALMLTGTKFGIAAAALSLIVFFVLILAKRFLTREHLKRLIIIAIVLAPILVVFSGPVRQRVRAAEMGGAQVHSTLFRLYAWRSTINMIREHPLVGLGPGTFDIAYPRYAIAGPTKYAHQSYLQIGAETGIPALVAFLITLSGILWRSLVDGIKHVEAEALLDRNIDAPVEPSQREPRLSRSCREPGPSIDRITWDDLISPKGWHVVNCSLLAALVGSCVRNLVDSDWYVMGIALPFVISAGVLVARSGVTGGSVSLSRIFKIGLVVSCAILVVLTGSFGLGDYYAPDGMHRDKQCFDFLSRYRKASRISPLNPRFHRDLGWCEAFYGKDSSRARKELDIATKLAPTDASNYFVRGLIAAHDGDMKEAIKYFRRSLRFNPNSTQTIYQLALSYRAMGDERNYELSLKRLLDIERSPYEQIRGVPELVDLTYVHAHLYFGDIYERRNNYRAAAAEYEAVINRIERWRSSTLIINVQRALGELTREEERQVITTLRQTYLRLARVYKLAGEPDRAREAIKKAKRVYHNNL